MTVRPQPLSRVVLSLCLAAACGLSAVAATPRPAAPRPTATPAASHSIDTPDYKIDTDNAHYNLESGDFTMPNHVKFSRPGTDAVSDRASGNTKRGLVTLVGNVVVHDSGNAAEAGTAYHGSGPATLTCNQLDIDVRAKLYTAVGNVHFTQGTRTASADKGILDRGKGLLHLEGNVHLSNQGTTMSSNFVDYNLNTKDADVGGNVHMEEPPGQQPAPAAPRATAKPAPKPTRKP